MDPRIVCAANKSSGGHIILGIRHWDQFMHNQANLLPKQDYWIQGFIDQFGTFYSRADAFQLAAKNHQIIRLVGNPTSTDLYSEHLY